MLDIVKEYYDDIVRSLNYIIDRNKDICVDEEDDYILESLDYKYLRHGCERFVIFICDKKFEIDFSLTIDDAKYILDHVNDISYLYFERDMVDSIIGDIKEFFNNDFVRYDIYDDFVHESQKQFDKETIISYIKEKCLNV